MAVALVCFVYQYGDNVPYFDDWFNVPAWTGHEPITLQWLWSQYQEHRMPIQKLLWLGLFRISGGDFRAGMFFSLAALIFMTVLMLHAVFRIRGRLAITDAFIPLLLLSWGHYADLLWTTCAGYVAITLLAVLPIYMIARCSMPSRSTALTMATIVGALPLTGAIGLAFAVPLSAWMLLAAGALRKEDQDAARNLGLGGVLGLTLVALYLVGYKSSNVPHSAGLTGWLQSTLDFLSLSIGPLGGGTPNSSNLSWPALAPLVPGSTGGISVRDLLGCAAGTILLVGTIINAVHSLRDRGEFVRRSGMALMIVGSLVLALAVGWGRRRSLLPRYVTLGVPGLLAVYVSTTLRPECRLGKVLRGTLFLSAMVAAWPNLTVGWLNAQWRHNKVAPFLGDLQADVPPLVLADHYTRLPNALHVRPHEAELAEDMRMLKSAGIGEFRHLHDDPVYQTLDISTELVARVDGVAYSLKAPRHVYAIRLNYQYLPHSSPGSWAVCRVTWLPLATSGEPRTREYACWLPKDGPEDHVLVWVNEKISQFHISPDDGQYCRIRKVQLLVPPA
jgi:hypothetical protein